MMLLLDFAVSSTTRKGGKKTNNTATGSITILTEDTSHSINMFIIVTMLFVHTIKAYILGDFNGRVGCDNDSWDGII